MPDMERADQLVAIGRMISRVPTGNKHRPYFTTPPPLIGMWAAELYDYGLRFHPEFASKELVRPKSPAGNFGPVQEVAKGSPQPPAAGDGPDRQRMQKAHELLMEWLQVNDPEMARRVSRAQNDPVAAAVLLNDIRREHPDILTKGDELLAQLADVEDARA